MMRVANDRDIAELVRLRRLMFEEMGFDVSDDSWEAPVRDLMRTEMCEQRLAGLVVEAPDGSGVVACGIVQFGAALPSPGSVSTTQAHISSMSTDRVWRRHGFARQILDGLVAACVERGVEVVTLHATDAGWSLYQAAGFRPAAGNPLLQLELGR